MNCDKIKQIIVKVRNNPRYFLYYWQNHHYFRRFFPRIYNFLYKTERRNLNIGGVSKLKKLHIILRTTDFVMNINSSRQLEDIGIISKNDVIRFGGCTLFKAAAYFADEYSKENIRITLITDKLSDKGMSQYQQAADKVGLSFDVINAKGHGNGPTFLSQVDIALKDSDDTLAFILEDDYLLDENTFTICFKIMQSHSNIIGMNPHFHPDRVRCQDIGKIAVIDGRLYSQVKKTCCTFFMPVGQMRTYEKYLRIYDGWENGSINSIWEKGICLAPLGWSLAEHLHRNDLSPINKLTSNHEDIV